MQVASKDYIIHTVFKTNTLPIISECNTSCIFCSHKQNPDDLEIYRMPKLELSDFEEIIEFMSPNKKIVIGEAATRIIEGEPLLHRNFIQIIKLIRQRFKNTPVQITTNGILLSEEIIDSLVKLNGIELNISINCIQTEKRKRILGLKVNNDIASVVRRLKGRMKFSGSCVIVPEIMNWKDVEELVALLDENEAEQVRIFLPGYTSRSEAQVDLFKLYYETKSALRSFIDKYSIPVIIEPSFIKELDCKIEGVIRNTPSHESGLMTGDVILSVNGGEVSTRVDAFEKVFRAYNPSLEIKRNDIILNVKLIKKRNCAPGFITLYDIKPDFGVEISELVRRHSAKKVLLLTSVLAENIISNYMSKSEFNFEYKIAVMKNLYFGGNISCAGLLTAQDIIEQAKAYLNENDEPDLILLPAIMFDFKMNDLLGISIKDIEKALNINVETL